MKAVVIHEYGGPDVLKFEEYLDPDPGPGEVLVKVAAASINPIDTMERAGDTKAWNPIKFPGILGWDVSGTIVKAGSGVDGFQVGDEVFAWSAHTYAELCVVKTEFLVKVPKGLDLVESAALPLVGITGSQLISIAGDVKSGQTVLVSGATGGVGRAAVFTALDCGATVIAGVQTKHLEEARSLGASHVVALDDETAMAAMDRVDVIANTVRGQTAEALLHKVKPGGIFASATRAPGNAKEYPDVRVVGFVSRNDAKTLLYVAQGMRDGKLAIPIGLTLRLSEVSRGHAALAKGGTGKILLVP